MKRDKINITIMLFFLLLLTSGLTGCSGEDDVVLEVKDFINYGIRIEPIGTTKLPHKIQIYYDEDHPSWMNIRHKALRVLDVQRFYLNVSASLDGITLVINEESNQVTGDSSSAIDVSYRIGPLENGKTYHLILKTNGTVLTDKAITLTKELNETIEL